MGGGYPFFNGDEIDPANRKKQLMGNHSHEDGTEIWLWTADCEVTDFVSDRNVLRIYMLQA